MDWTSGLNCRSASWISPEAVFALRKVHLPYGWLESRRTTHAEREQLFGDDPMDAEY